MKEKLKDLGKIKEANRDVKAREGGIQIEENDKTKQRSFKVPNKD